jgi:hypothetical protein
MPLADYLATRIWQKLGAESDAAWAIDPTGQEVAYCCFIVTLRDWARLGLMLATTAPGTASRLFRGSG